MEVIDGGANVIDGQLGGALGGLGGGGEGGELKKDCYFNASMESRVEMLTLASEFGIRPTVLMLAVAARVKDWKKRLS